MQGIGATGILLLLVTSELDPTNVVVCLAELCLPAVHADGTPDNACAQGFCIAFSNAFGLIAGAAGAAASASVLLLKGADPHLRTPGIFLMGYGLVAVPRLLWRIADVQGQQRMLYAQAGQQAEAALHARRWESRSTHGAISCAGMAH